MTPSLTISTAALPVSTRAPVGTAGGRGAAPPAAVATTCSGSRGGISLSSIRGYFARGARLGISVPAGGRQSRVGLGCRAQGSYDDYDELDEPYDFDPKMFHQVALHYVEVEPSEGTGTLLFTQVEEDIDEETRCLTVKIGGDTMFAILTELGHNSGIDRPMTVNLLWKVLQRGAELASKTSKLLFVAIVGTQDQVFLGRLFFGDAKTGEVHWDCDCRPSDAAWLSLRDGCPFMVHREVWDEISISYDHALETMNGLKEMSDAQLEDDALGAGDDWDEDGEDGEESGREGALPAPPLVKSKYDYTTVRGDDPIEVTRLKRELAIAVKEENYAEAKRIRDHPYLKMYSDVMRLRKEERLLEALEMSQNLINLINMGEGESTLPRTYFKGSASESES